MMFKVTSMHNKQLKHASYIDTWRITSKKNENVEAQQKAHWASANELLNSGTQFYNAIAQYLNTEAQHHYGQASEFWVGTCEA